MSRRRKTSTRSLIVTIFIIGLVVGFLIGYEIGKVLAPKAGLEITIVYGSEKRSWMEEVIPIFEKEWLERHGTPVKIVSVPMGSRESMNQLVLLQITPTIWSPASSVWINLANRLWAEIHPDIVRDYGSLIQEWHPLVHSPIVIVTWETFANKHQITGFQNLHDLAVSQHGEVLKFAHTDPQLSNSGMMAVILETAVAANKEPAELTVEDLTNPQIKKWLTQLESRAVYYGKSTGFLAEQMISTGPDRMNVVVAYESLVIEKNKGGEPLARWGEKLVAVYPQKGTLSSDHPFCIVNAPWTKDPEIRKAAEEFLRFLLRGDIQAKAMETGFRPENKTVQISSEIFNSNYGVSLDIPCKILDSNVNGEVLWKITDLWIMCKAR